MLFKVFTPRPQGKQEKHKGRARFRGFRSASGLLTALLSASLLGLSVPAGSAVAAGSSRGGKADPELMLIDVYKALGSDHLRVAQEKAEALVTAYPNFHLGQLIYGDLLMMNEHVVNVMGDAPNAPEDKLKSLREEAVAHLYAMRAKPDPNLVPSTVLQLREDQKHVLLVDASLSRLFVYENIDGQLKFQDDYYISQGKLGVNKQSAGDQKTPLGVYYITGRLPGARLPEFYGVGALPINYPNEWDRVNGRSGSGIWLHGTPHDSFMRPPLSSDGCVVLANPDLHKIYESIEPGKTPVVIADHVQFVSKEKWISERSAAAKLVDAWRRDVESANPVRVMANYSRNFKSPAGEDLNTWFPKQAQYAPGTGGVSLSLKDATYFLYPGQQQMMVSTFTEEGGGRAHFQVRKRQYWALEGKDWKIVSETNL
ncbi:MAG TPA: L,D-transpeptidase family protein [Burkholderiaceae bacterium]